MKLSDYAIVINNSNDNNKVDLMQDIISVLYSFSTRMYGRRKVRKSKIIKALQNMNE